MPWVTLQVPAHPKTRRMADGTYYSHDGKGRLQVRLHHVAELGRQGGVRPIVPVAPPAPAAAVPVKTPAPSVSPAPPAPPAPPLAPVVPPAPLSEASEAGEVSEASDDVPEGRPKRHRGGS